MTGALRRVLYTTEASAAGGRDGEVRLLDGTLALGLRRPPGLGGPEADATDAPAANPEQLFALGFAGCFHGSIQANADRLGLDATGSRVVARVSLGTLESGGLGLAVELDVTLPAVDPARHDDLLTAAHGSCPYTRAVRENIDLRIRAVPADGAVAGPAGEE